MDGVTKRSPDAETTRELLELTNGQTDHSVTNPGTRNDVTVEKRKDLIYGINDSPPIYINLFCGLQHGLMALSTQLVISLMVADVVCASDNDTIKSKLLSSTLLMSGITTIAMTVFGVRIPIFQGATSVYIIPLLLMSNQDDTFCSGDEGELNSLKAQFLNSTSGYGNNSVSMAASLLEDKIYNNIQKLQGSLMAVGVIHALFGCSGLLTILLKYIGPLTIVPTKILSFIFFAKPAIKYAEANWGVTFSTVVVSIVLSLYLAERDMSVPFWNRSRGFHVIRFPVHKIFSVLIAIVFNWLLCGLLTYVGALTDDPSEVGYRARTDARIQIVSDMSWFNFPYPGQFGPIQFSDRAFVAFLVATLLSILDSIGDYYACARVCRVPVGPAHAVNRGILTEGICTFFSGVVGCGHATSSYGINAGAIAITKVASRSVFVCAGLTYVVFAVFAKISAIFVSIPYPVLGGAILVMFGLFIGVIISHLQVTSMSSPRNMAILGLSTFIGLVIPTWANQVSNPVNTGIDDFDRIMSMLLRNPNLAGMVIACFLDNTVPGTLEERGLAAWQEKKDADGGIADLDPELYDEGYEVYEPLLPQRVLYWRIVNYIPFLPYKRPVGKEEKV